MRSRPVDMTATVLTGLLDLDETLVITDYNSQRINLCDDVIPALERAYSQGWASPQRRCFQCSGERKTGCSTWFSGQERDGLRP